MATPGVPNWQAQILHAVGAPVTPANLTFLNAWARAEGGSASNNPFNTTQTGFGATGNYNSVGVKNYATPQGGIQATVNTLQNGRYGNILGALRQGSNAMAAAQALANSPWGTGSLVERILGGGGQVTAPPPPVQTPGVAPPVRPLPARQIPKVDLTALFNAGNRMFGLPELPAGSITRPGSAPPRQPTQAPSSPPSATAPATKTKPPRVSGPTLRYIEHFAAPFGLTITSTTGGKHAKNSYHYRGRAVDFGGDPAKMAALAKYGLSHAGQFQELIYTGPGSPGFSILGGKVIPNSELDPGLFKQHEDHVHLAR